MSNRDFPAPYRPDRGWEPRTGDNLAGRSDRLPGSRSAADGYSRASDLGDRGRGVGEVDGYDRSPGGRSSGGGRGGGQHAQGRSSRGSARDSDERSQRRGTADAPANGRGGDGHRSGRDAPGAGPGPDRDGRASARPGRDGLWDERGGRSSRSRDAAQLGGGRRDVKDDLRERLRRNGIGGADSWDRPGRRSGRNGTGPDGLDDSVVGRLRGRMRPNAAAGAWRWGCARWPGSQGTSQERAGRRRPGWPRWPPAAP